MTRTKTQEQGALPKPKRCLFHKFFILISIITSLVALWMAVGQILGILVYENSPVQYALRAYVILLSLVVILVELEWPAFARESTILRNWISRGFIYVFIGIVGMQENETAVVRDEENDSYEIIGDVLTAVAWNMIGCGILYSVMGILCLQYVLRRMRKSYQERVELAKLEAANGDIETGDSMETNEGDKEAKKAESTESHPESDEVIASNDLIASNEVEVSNEANDSGTNPDNEVDKPVSDVESPGAPIESGKDDNGDKDKNGDEESKESAAPSPSVKEENGNEESAVPSVTTHPPVEQTSEK